MMDETLKTDLINLPEAPSSITFLVTGGDGIEYRITLRDIDDERLLNRAGIQKERLRARGAEQKVAAPEPVNDAPREDWCSIHNVRMYKRTGTDGQVWYSHKDDKDGWCKGVEK